MSSNAERPPIKRSPRGEVVIGFSPETVRAPFLLRCGALLIDYLLIISAPVLFLLLGRYFGEDGTALINGDLNNVGWLIAVVIAIADLIILPSVAGQSVGKLIAGIRIVNRDGSMPGFKQMLFRQTVGYLTAAVTLGLGFMLSAMNRKGRAFHDLISGTTVIYAAKRPAE